MIGPSWINVYKKYTTLDKSIKFLMGVTNFTKWHLNYNGYITPLPPHYGQMFPHDASQVILPGKMEAFYGTNNSFMEAHGKKPIYFLRWYTYIFAYLFV